MPPDFGSPVNTTEWRPEPNQRGTFAVLSSCVLTLILCMWTAVHLNVAAHREPGNQVLRRIKWLAIGLFAPDVVTWVAFEQHRESKAVNREMKKRLDPLQSTAYSPPPPPPWFKRVVCWIRSLFRQFAAAKSSIETDPESIELGPVPDEAAAPSDGTTKSRMNPWTMIHSHYAVMGGFVFDTDATKRPPFLPDHHTRVALTSQGLLELAQHAPHLIPDISVSQIRDKSKASSLAKTFVILQASWFITQFIYRVVQGLTVSLLELNTFAHTLFALLAYYFWWHKPLDVAEPTLIEGKDADLFCAGMTMRSSVLDSDAFGGAYFFPEGDFCARLSILGPPKYLWARNQSVYPSRIDRQHAPLTPAYTCSAAFFLRHGPNSKPLWGEIDPPPEFEKMTRENVEAELFNEMKKKQHLLYMGQSMFGFQFRPDSLAHYVTPKLLKHVLSQVEHPYVKSDYRKHLSGVIQCQGFKKLQRPYLKLSLCDILRLKLARDCADKYPDIYPGSGDVDSEYPFKPLVAKRINNWPLCPGRLGSNHWDDPGDTWHPKLLVSFAITGIAYGGMHLLAWNVPDTDQFIVWLWRGSALYLMAIASPAFLVYAVALIFARAARDRLRQYTWWDDERALCRFMVSFGKLWLIQVPDILVGLVLGASLITRGYIVVESLINIRKLPEGVFELPSWAKLFPHLG